MRIIMKAKKGCWQISPNNTFLYDIWFIGVNTVEEANAEGVYYCGSIKMSHKGFFLAMLEKLMK